MPVLVLVRHGKASAFSQDGYDQLSEPGFAQARALGEHWIETGATFDRVYVGPRKRHAQTYETVAHVMRDAGRALPVATRVEELDEHDGIGLMFKMLPELARDDETIRALALALARGERPVTEMLGVFRRVTRRWARGEINHAEVETWTAFRARVERGVAKMIGDVAHGARIAAFTSGGTVAAAVGRAVGASDETVLDLSWSLYNGALTEIACSERGHRSEAPNGGWRLVSFNGTPHLRDAKLVTSV